jgi:hypothetical protein
MVISGDITACMITAMKEPLTTDDFAVLTSAEERHYLCEGKGQRWSTWRSRVGDYCSLWLDSYVCFDGSVHYF